MTGDTCGRAKRDGSGEDCSLPAGWGTDHVGEGACKLHGGAGGAPTGEDNGAFKHGLFADHLPEEDREAVDALEGHDDADKLDELIDWRLTRLRRAARALNDQDDDRTFWDAFDDLVDTLSGEDTEPTPDHLRELARMLDQGNESVREEIDLVRKLIKDRNKIAEGEDVNVGWIEALEGGDS